MPSGWGSPTSRASMYSAVGRGWESHHPSPWMLREDRETAKEKGLGQRLAQRVWEWGPVCSSRRVNPRPGDLGRWVIVNV